MSSFRKKMDYLTISRGRVEVTKCTREHEGHEVFEDLRKTYYNY